MLEQILENLRRLDLDAQGNIKTTISNLRVVNSIRNKLLSIVLNDEYIKDVKEYVNTFREVTTLQNKYWKSIEPTYKPRKILKEIRKQAIGDTVNLLTEGGIGVNIADEITGILKSNITTGGSYRQLEQQLRDSLMNNRTGEGRLEKYTKQITTDAINQYSAQVTNIVSADLGAEWYQIQGTEIKTTRGQCQAMLEKTKYFHVCQIPNLLKGKDIDGNDLTYSDINTGEIKKVEIYQKTKLPQGMIQGTNPENYLIYRNGYQCGHQFRPVLRESTIPLEYRNKVYSSPLYQAWKQANG